MRVTRKGWLLTALLVALGIGGYYAWQSIEGHQLPPGIASGNGRVEAVEIDVATKIPGRVKEILVNEGDFVDAGQIVARMDTAQLDAEHRQAEAQLQRAVIGVQTARSVVTQREAERTAAAAVVAQREAELDGAQRKLTRSEELVKSDTVSRQTLDNDRVAAQAARAGVGAAQAQLAASEAGISAAEAQVVDATAAVGAAQAAIERITADINDSTLRAPREGRVQYRVAQPGEVLSAGGRVLNLVDLADVYMTFFLPTSQAGRVALGADVRIVLDALPNYAIPAEVSFVSDVAQFTPKSVETAAEREKLMFRTKAMIAPELLRKYIRQVKTGLPGVAYVRLEPNAPWPSWLPEKLLQ